MTVLITGGAGVFGRAMINYLFDRGYRDIRSLDIAPLPQMLATKVHEIRGDIRNLYDVRIAMQSVDFVIHAAAALPSYKNEEIFSIDVLGTKTLLHQALASNVKRFIHLSSTAVYGVPDKVPSSEEDERLPYDAYNSAKIEAELACEEYRQIGLQVAILRPKAFLGPGRLGLFGMLFEWAYEGHHFPVVGSGEVPYQFLHVSDLCAVTDLAMQHPCANDTFNIAAHEFTTVREDFQAVLDAAGHGKRIIPLPLRPAAFILQALEATRLSPVYKRLYLKLVSGSYVETAKAKDILGFSARYSNKDALLETYRWYCDNRPSLSKETGVSHTSLWKQGALRIGKTVL
ncbi:NAD-dependent epimerase/dehydratase family protein [Aliirhizobium smilacinae]|uniref:NAD-dependent epimerase/dehydratase family protein n=1 Tax=Aliirhizobium smilacinae TaxID=1395944 RepID=A0A5C4X8Y3_9HYPH|nr:NAD-dependent epimerase/dehydratase family protein [Rhizobium smilacinae]TNM59896.1 NAD-dependent epimerase/dehydratase family protein [Rhizobium smilacinae]